MKTLLRWFVWAFLSGAGPAAFATPSAPVSGPRDGAECDARDAGQVRLAAPVQVAAAQMPDRRRIAWPGAAGVGARYWLAHSVRGIVRAPTGGRIGGADGRIALAVDPDPLAPALERGQAPVAAGVRLRLPAAAIARLPALLRQQLLVVETDRGGRVQRATALQLAGALDDLYARAASVPDLGVTVAAGRTSFKVWAPTAQRVALCLHADGAAPARASLPMRLDRASGVWSVALPADLSGGTYTYLVDVFARAAGWVRNRVTDPYSVSLTTDSQRSWIGRLDAPALLPEGWAASPRPDTVKAATDLVIYELHVRDFSASDDSVSPAHRGKYLAFTESGSRGMQHLRALAAAGVTDVHLLPVFDFATVPERGCVTPPAEVLERQAPDSEAQQALVMASAATDCYNWGYDPWHYGAPEGSYASDAADGAVRIVELRRMVLALHRAGLRVGMDLVYNHTSAAGQAAHSVLDRIVPGYYQRLNAQGEVETSTCCANTATEHLMMAKLMIDTAVRWARDYRIDSFRFDLMGHQPRAAMEQLQRAVDAATQRHVALIGEGWNFGEVAGGALFVQAAQGQLAGSGIGTFSDRGRDAVRGGGCCDDAAATLGRQGWINGLFYDSNGRGASTAEDLRRSADLVRVGLAGTLRDLRMTTQDGSVRALREIDYAGQGAGYASEPDEVVNYVENHDNPTLFDIGVLKLPPATDRDERARVQVLGLAVTMFSQGIAYFHAGVEALRSKSLDRNSYDSGDWFNRLDWTFSDNHFGSGLPPKPDNGALWPAMRPLLADPAIKPDATQIRFVRDAFLDLLRIRAGSTLFRLRSAQDIAARLTFHNTGPSQQPTVIVGQLDGRGLAGARYAEVLYAINVGKEAARLALPTLGGRAYVLHPVHRAPGAADPRPAALAHWDAATATLDVPARTALVYVLD